MVNELDDRRIVVYLPSYCSWRARRSRPRTISSTLIACILKVSLDWPVVNTTLLVASIMLPVMV